MSKKILTIILTLLLAVSFVLPVSAYDNPQPRSCETVGDIPEVNVPAEPEEQEGIIVYLNKTEIPMTVSPYEENGTVYIPACELFSKLGFDVTVRPSTAEIVNANIAGKESDVSAVFDIGKNTGKINGKEVELAGITEKKDDEVMMSADALSLVSNEKVWYDADSATLVITTGSYKTDGILRIINGKLWMDGEPFYEISFNKFDLFYQTSSYFATEGTWPSEEYQVEAAEAALSQLEELGFKTIRVFVHSNVRNAYVRSSKQREKYYTICDKFFDMCDEHNIKVVVCMGLTSGDFCPKGEDVCDLICNPESESRKNMYDFIDTFIARYKDRKSVLMWEIVNEGNLDADVGINVGAVRWSIYQLGNFYADTAKRIKAIDTEHLITGGDSGLRDAQWHLYMGVKSGSSSPNWTRDTLEDRLKAYTVLYHDIDVISVHTYSWGLGDSAYQTSDTDETMVPASFELLMNEAKRMGKPLYNGETAVNADSYDEEVFELSKVYIDSIIDAGVQISHWWNFRSDRQGNFHDGYGWDISYGELLEAIIAGNRKLQETYVVNGVTVKTEGVWEGSENAKVMGETVPETAGTVTKLSEDVKTGCKSVMGTASCAAAVIACAVILRKKKH